MLLFIESSAFPFRTFVVRVKYNDTVARVRAQMLHTLYEIGREDHQFRLRFNGIYLRDADTLEDYDLMENAIIKMIPLSRNSKMESMVDVHSLSSEETGNSAGSSSLGPDVKQALDDEVKVLNSRERIIRDFKGLVYIHFLGVFFSFFTFYWYSGFWTLVLWLGSWIFCPTFTRTGGYMGNYSIYKEAFCIVYGILSLLNIGASLYLSAIEWIRVVGHGCVGWLFIGDCSHVHVFSGIFFAIHAVVLIASCALVWFLLANMKFEVGDSIEKFLVQTRDIELVMKAARKGRVKERRIAAYELATLAASGEDNKFRIVAEGGLEVLIRMALSADLATQEHAVEAISELLTIPAIQDSLVDMGGVRTLTALLHSPEQRLVHEAAVALSYIVSDSDDNKGAVVNDHGLEDLCHAASTANLDTQRIVAGIFLELAFNANIRAQMAQRNTPAAALIKLCKGTDPDTQRYAFQTLELLAIESADMICAQEELLPVLLQLPAKTADERILLLAGKILLYFAENREMCEQMLDYGNIRESLALFARSKDIVIQKVVVKVIYCALEVKELRYRAQHLGLDQILKDIREHSAERETWDMADQALQFMFTDDDDLTTLPHLSTTEKMERMSRQHDDSKTSISSSASAGKPSMSLYDSTGNVRKGID